MKKNRASGLLTALIITLISLSVITMTDDIQAHELAPKLYKTTLDNGETVIVKETPGSKVVTVQIWVRAGSVYEESSEAGITHIIEHMIFKGTPNRGPGELAGAIEGVGGRVNAYTYYEYTVYHATLSARHWELALDVLTDAVLNSSFDPVELEREKKVVLEEVGMRNDRPNIKLFEEMMSRAYAVHPYRLPVIGNQESIAACSRQDILNYMDKHYRPENFTFVVVGDVRGIEIIDRIKTMTAGLVRGEFRQPPLPQEPLRNQPEFITVTGDINQPQMSLALPISPFNSPDTPVLDIISQILGQGETSRLYRSLRDEKRLVYGIDSSAFTPHDPGLLEIFAVLDSASMLPALEATLVELFKLKYLYVTDEELERAKRNLESEFIFNLETVDGQARSLGSFEFMAGDPREDDYLDKVRAVNREDVKKTAAEYFDGQRLTAGFLIQTGTAVDLDENKLQAIIARAEAAARDSRSDALLTDTYLTNVHRFTLPNGIRLLVREDDTVPTVAIRAVFPGGLRAETPTINGAFAFISELLPKGSKSMNAQEIALEVENMAGDLSGFNGKNTYGLKADFLKRFYERGLELLSDVIINPAFDENEAEKIRPELLSRLKQQDDSLTSIAFREFNRLLFDGHPYGLNTAGSEQAIKSFTAAILRDIYRQHARPDQLVLAVSGDVEAEKVRDIVTSLFGGWTYEKTESKTDIQEDILTPSAPAGPNLHSISRDKEQVHLIIGFLGTAMNSPDRYALEVLDTILSGQSGRLFTELRDRQSLAYSLSSFSLLGLDTGAFGIYIATSPDKKQQAIDEIWQELQKVRTEPVSEEELAKAKSMLIGSYELGLQTRGAQALDLALNESYDLGQDFGNRYINEIEKVDAGAVMAVAVKYTLPDHYVMVTVGAGAAGKNTATE